jgi:large subunit ribosomal protein L3
MAMLLGKKIGMTQIYDEQGKMCSVSVIQAGPCTITQVKTKDSDGYSAVQLGYGDVKASRQKKPAIGHFRNAKTDPKHFIRELRLEESQNEYELGQELDVEVFEQANYVDIVGTSKGKGFAGGMKRHGFGGFPASHGCERKHRAPGSISSYASDAGHGGNLKKGKKMAGHMGNVRVTTKNHKLISIDKDKNIIVVKGAVAGPAGGYVVIKTAKTKK